MDLKQTLSSEKGLVVTVQTGTNVMNGIEGEKLKSEHWYDVTYRINAGGQLLPTQIVEIPRWPVLKAANEISTPQRIAASGYSAVDRSGDLYLCEKPNTEVDHDGPWAVLTSDGNIHSEIQSIHAATVQFPRLLRHAWDPSDSRVVFSEDLSPDHPTAIQVKVWNYANVRSSLDTYNLDLFKAFELHDKMYSPKAPLLIRSW